MTLEKQAWHGYFERLTRAVVKSRAETQVDALPHGFQSDAPWVALVGVRYDAERDLIEIGFELADKTTEEYVINAPRQVSLDECEAGLAGMEVIDCNGASHRLTLQKPVEVEPPEAKAQRDEGASQGRGHRDEG